MGLGRFGGALGCFGSGRVQPVWVKELGDSGAPGAGGAGGLQRVSKGWEDRA